MNFSMDDVKTLREKTSAGMMDCKKALQEANGDMEKAFEVLRKKGAAIAQKKAGREAKEGVLGFTVDNDGKSASLLEVNCETDFVIKTEDFQNFVKEVTKTVHAKGPKDMGALMEAPYKGGTVASGLTDLIGKIGENIQVRRFVHWKKTNEQSVLGLYIHAGSKIGVLLEIDDAAKKVTSDAAKEIAMHAAAMQPRYVRPSEVPATAIEKEKEILMASIDAKKPKEIQEKIVQGKLNKFYSEVCLEEQIFVKDLEGKTTVKQWLQQISPSAKISRFVRLQVGAE